MLPGVGPQAHHRLAMSVLRATKYSPAHPLKPQQPPLSRCRQKY